MNICPRFNMGSGKTSPYYYVTESESRNAINISNTTQDSKITHDMHHAEGMTHAERNKCSAHDHN